MSGSLRSTRCRCRRGANTARCCFFRGTEPIFIISSLPCRRASGRVSAWCSLGNRSSPIPPFYGGTGRRPIASRRTSRRFRKRADQQPAESACRLGARFVRGRAPRVRRNSVGGASTGRARPATRHLHADRPAAHFAPSRRARRTAAPEHARHGRLAGADLFLVLDFTRAGPWRRSRLGRRGHVGGSNFWCTIPYSGRTTP